MKHFADPNFWNYYDRLPEPIQQLADKDFRLLKENPNHPSLHFKKVKKYRSVRVGLSHRALGVMSEDDAVIWFWIGTHREYERLIKRY